MALEANVKEEENGGSAVDDESVDENVSDVEDDGHFPHLLHLRLPTINTQKIQKDRFKRKGKDIKSAPGTSAKEKQTASTRT